MSASAAQGGHNKAIVDYTSPALCTPVTHPSPGMRPIVTMPEEDRATDIGNMHKNLVKIARVVRRYPRGQIDTSQRLPQAK